MRKSIQDIKNSNKHKQQAKKIESKVIFSEPSHLAEVRKDMNENNEPISSNDFLPQPREPQEEKQIKEPVLYADAERLKKEIAESKAWTAVNYGDAEKQRMLKAIATNAASTATGLQHVLNKAVETGEQNYIAMQQQVKAVQQSKAESNPKAETHKLTLEHYKTLKKLERFYIALEKDNVLYGMNAHEQQELMNVMQEAFRPGYTADLWCGHCIMEFIKDVYREFNNWQAREKEQLENYKTLLVQDNF